jgi:hypothetical protein
MKSSNKLLAVKPRTAGSQIDPQYQRYVQNHYVKIPGQEFEGDGVVGCVNDSVEAWQESMKAIGRSKELWKTVRSFAAQHKGPGGCGVVEEHVILDKMK